MKILKKNLSVILLSTVFLAGTTSIAYAGPSAFIQQTLWDLVNTVFGTILGWCGLLLNVGVTDFVIGFGDKFTGGTGVAVDLLWQSVRDIFNLTFIFALVYIGFKMILGSDDSRTRSWLAHLVLAALLVNFSLYITKFIVDLSNIIATEIVQDGFPNIEGEENGISGYFMNNLGIGSLLGGDGGDLAESLTTGENSAWGLIFGTAMLFIVASFVFLAGGIMLIIRYVALSLFMVLSPLMFLGWVFPNMSSYTSRYWSNFLGRAFYAPVYVLLIYFSAKIIDGYYNSGANINHVNFGKLLTGNGTEVIANFSTTLPPFILSCAFLIAAVVVGQKMGADGANVAVKIGNSAISRVRSGVGYMAGGATFGAAGYVGRRSVGYGAQRLADNDSFKGFAARNSIIGKGAYKATQAVAGSSFDGRNVAGLGKSLNIGAGAKGGYKQRLEAQAKKDADFIKDLGEINIDTPEAKAAIEKRAEELRAEAEKEKVDLNAKKAEKETEVNNKKSTLSSEITNLKKQEFSASTKEEQDKIKKEREQKETDIQKIDEEFKTFNVTLTAQMKDIQKKAAEALTQAETEKKYAHVITYMNELNKTEKFFNKAGMILGGGFAGSSAGVGGFALGGAAVGAGAFTAGTAAGGGVVSSYAYEAQSRRKALEKIYGKDGMKKADSERKKKKAKEYIEAASDAIDKEEPAKPAAEPQANS